MAHLAVRRGPQSAGTRGWFYGRARRSGCVRRSRRYPSPRSRWRRWPPPCLCSQGVRPCLQ
eukprot:4202571-Prymnesium_polylepis.1